MHTTPTLTETEQQSGECFVITFCLKTFGSFLNFFNTFVLKKNYSLIIGSAEALPILCVRYIRWERERERETQRERERERRKWRHHCRAKIGDEFCTSPCQKCAPQYWRRVLRFSLPKFCTSVSHLLKCAEFTLSIAKNVALFETVRILRTVKWRDWQGIEAAKHAIEFPAAPFFFLVEKIEKMNQINTKNYWK